MGRQHVRGVLWVRVRRKLRRRILLQLLKFAVHKYLLEQAALTIVSGYTLINLRHQ